MTARPRARVRGIHPSPIAHRRARARRSRELARRPNASRHAFDDDGGFDFIGAFGEHVAFVGVGARGCALVDELKASRAFPRASAWALDADVSTLERTGVENRWRLPPTNVEVTAKAVFENATSAASAVLGMKGKASGEAPRTVVVACAGGEASESAIAFVRALSEEKNSKAKKGFFGFRGSARAPEGAVMIAGVVEPFAFEGRRRDAAAKEFLREASSPGTCDIVLAVSQTELIKNGESGMSVQEATSTADASLLFSLLSACDALRADVNCWDTFRRGEASDLDAWTPQNDKQSLRQTVNKALAKRGGGCGVAHVGRGVAEVPTYGSADEATASAARNAIAVAAQQSPFLAPGRFDTAYLVVCTVSYGGPALGPIARETISSALSEYTRAEQFIALPKPDKRGTTDIEVSLLCITDAETAALPAPESTSVPFVEADKPKVNAMLFVPGYTGEGAVETAKRKTQKLTSDDLKKFGFGDPKAMVEQLNELKVSRGVGTSGAPMASASAAQSGASRKSVTARQEDEPVVFSFGGDRENNVVAAVSVPSKDSTPVPATASPAVTRVPLPRDFDSDQVAVRISEPKLDATGNVIGYRSIDANGVKKDAGDSNKDGGGGGIFGWRPNKAKKEEKSNLSKRALGMLENDRSGLSMVRMEFANMSVYEGEWYDGKREGDGRQVFADGDSYEGKWQNGKPDGKGRLSFKNGGYFEGLFNAGRPSGRGTFVRNTGETFTGAWFDGVLEESDQK